MTEDKHRVWRVDMLDEEERFVYSSNPQTEAEIRRLFDIPPRAKVTPAKGA